MLIQTEQYLFLIDVNADIKDSYFLWKNEVHKWHSDAGYGIKTWTGFNEKDGSSEIVNWSNNRGKIIAYYPLSTEAKQLYIPMLPHPFKEDTRQVAIEIFEKEIGRKFNKNSFGDCNSVLAIEHGYKVGKSDKRFSVEDLYSAFNCGITYELSGRQGVGQNELLEYIEKISDEKLPKEFIPEYEECCPNIRCRYGSFMSSTHPCKVICSEIASKLKTTTNFHGEKELVGQFVY